MNISCIYFLFFQSQLLYIGKTTNLRNRMLNHPLNFQYNVLRWIQVDSEKLDDYEKRLITILKPLYNIQHNTKNINKRSQYASNIIPPIWIYDYDKMRIVKKRIDEGDIYPNESKEDLAFKLADAELKYNYLYKKHSFDKTILDQIYWQEDKL